jgi:superfamily II DNA or RNA helicase
MINLRPHQADVVDKLDEGFSEHRCQLLYAPTGFGKTEVAMHMMVQEAKKGTKVAMVLDRIVLVNQTSTRLSKYGIAHGVMQSGHWRYRPYERIQVCSAQTLERRSDFPEVGLLIIDECFPGDTLIETVSGLKRIDTIKDGEVIYNATGVGIVRSVFSKAVSSTVILRLSNGTKLECTPDHPIFTELGWRPAGSLERGSQLFCNKSVRALWEGDPSINHQIQAGGLRSGGRNSLQQAAFLRDILRQEVEQSNAQRGDSKEGVGHHKAHWSQAQDKGRQWDRLNSNGENVTGEAAKRLDSWLCSKDFEEAQPGISSPLQIGLSATKSKDLPGAGWGQSRPIKTANAGQEERCSAPPVWVESVQIVEHKGSRNVFNLRVGGHPSYFANGFLVHNCHVQRKQVIQYIKENPDVRVIGLTATPFTKGLGDTYSNVVGAKPTGELIEDKWLVPLKIFISKEIDMTGAKKVAGEWSQDEVSTRGMKITGDIVDEWITKTHQLFGGPRKTVVFASGVEHGRDLVRQFGERGYNFVSISYKEEDEFKRETIEDFSRPDTKIVGLIATDILTRGFDVPDVMIGVSARPFSKSFSSHVQQMGRIMRPCEGKTHGVWLDHSGNYLRFRKDWDDLFSDGVTSLPDGGEAAKKEPLEKVKKESKCGGCGALWIWPDRVCGECGWTRPMKEVLNVPGKMVELEAGKRSAEENQSFYSELLFFSRMRGYKDGWAAHKYKEKYGVFPRGLGIELKSPGFKTLQWIKSRNIAYAKARA